MAKKLNAKPTAPSVAPTAPTSESLTPTRRTAAGARTPAGRANKAAPAPRDATPPAPVPAPAAPLGDDPAAVTAPPKKAAKTSRTAPSAVAPASPILTKPAAKTKKAAIKAPAAPVPAMTSSAPATAPQKAADSLLKFAAKAVRLVGNKAAKLKKDAESSSTNKSPARRFAPARTPVTQTPREITQEEIAVRAYLISERRHQHGQHAEPHEDWAEAERQLQAEAARA